MMILLLERPAMTLQMYPLLEEFAMTPQTLHLLEEVAMTHQTCRLRGNIQGNPGRCRVKIHPLPGENPAHRYQVRNVHLILVGHHWLRGLRTDMIQTLTSHLHEKDHKR